MDLSAFLPNLQAQQRQMMEMSNNGGSMEPSTFLAILQAQQRHILDMMAYVGQRNNAQSGYVSRSFLCRASSNNCDLSVEW